MINLRRLTFNVSQPCRDEIDLDLDLDEISRGICTVSAGPPDVESDGELLTEEPSEATNCHSSTTDCLLYSDSSASFFFGWPGPNPLSIAASIDEMFHLMLPMSDLQMAHVLEFRLLRLDPCTGEMIAQDIFLLPRVETFLENLHRLQAQIFDILRLIAMEIRVPSFRLLVRPLARALPFHAQVSSPWTDHASGRMLLDPACFVHRLITNYR
ncbi:hypothetical protein N7478_010608 [Penicillium angulare]|uniref:uncharacterized protein n=1 Tax=Penicillium angulare TaxID=116970 RepID=UPI0025411CB4|nr:uncharacterized protein N7478_010608 [Penicillium angulare]KAJ5267800.1 hypothetical protein N7478_010608 [Penicillium angulare]